MTRTVVVLYALSGPAFWLHLGIAHHEEHEAAAEHHEHHEDGERHHHAIDHAPAPAALPRDTLLAIAAFPVAYFVAVEPAAAPAPAPAVPHVRPLASTEHARAPPGA